MLRTNHCWWGLYQRNPSLHSMFCHKYSRVENLHHSIHVQPLVSQHWFWSCPLSCPGLSSWSLDSSCFHGSSDNNITAGNWVWDVSRNHSSWSIRATGSTRDDDWRQGRASNCYGSGKCHHNFSNGWVSQSICHSLWCQTSSLSSSLEHLLSRGRRIRLYADSVERKFFRIEDHGFLL